MNTYTGTTTITAGELRLNPTANVTPNTQIILNGGKLSTTGITAGRTIVNSSTLDLVATSSIDLGLGDHSLKFADSKLITWNGNTLTITGWTGAGGASGTGGKLFFGAATGTLTSTQLAKITFTGYIGTPILLGTGELVPPLQIPILAITGETDYGHTCAEAPASSVGPKSYTITNTGVTADGVTISSGDPQFVVSNVVFLSPPATINALNGTATFDVTFTPSGFGAQSAIITVESSTPGVNSPTISLTGIGDEAPSATAGGSQTICSDGFAVVSGASASIGGIISWTENGAGSITAGADPLTPTYTADPDDVLNSPVTLTMTVTSACPNPSSATAIYTVNVANAVTVDAGPSDQTVCSTSPDVILQGLIGGSADAGFWSSNVPGGTFTPADGSYNPNPPYVTYTPPPGIVANGGDVTLTLTTVDQTEGFGGECFASKEDTMVIHVIAAPTVDAGANQAICAGSVVTLSPIVSGTNVAVGWSRNENASEITGFGDATLPSTTYTPTQGDIDAGTVTLWLTVSDPTNNCTFAKDSLVVTINKPATVEAGPIQSPICANGFITLAGSKGGSATSVTWSAPSGSFSDTSSLTSTYTPSIVSDNVETVMLTLTTNDPDGAGPCQAASDTMTVTVNPIPKTIGFGICVGGTGSLTSTTVCAPGATTNSGAKIARTATSTGTIAWTNKDNILLEESTPAYATASFQGPAFTSGNSVTGTLQGTNFGFAIPQGATINGIQVSIKRFASTSTANNNVKDNSIRLIDKDGVVVGSNHAISATNWLTANTTIVTYGSATDNWGINTWERTDINDSNFGISLSSTIYAQFSATVTASVDYMKITVFYTLNGLNWYTTSGISDPGVLVGSGTPFESGSFRPCRCKCCWYNYFLCGMCSY